MRFLAPVIVLLTVNPAWADRHCGPVLDSYYHARQAALDTETSCGAAIETTLQRVEETRANARICGCTSLIDGLDSIFAALRESQTTCDGLRGAILDDALDTRIKALVRACH